MTNPVSIADLFDEVEYDFWGATFRLREGTKSVAQKFRDKFQEWADLDETSEDVTDEQFVASLCDVLDVLLEFKEWAGEEDPDAKPKRPKKPTVKQLVLQRWKKDEIGVDRVEAIFHHIRVEAERRKRPTSHLTSDF